MALLHCESTVFPAKVGAFTVSYHKRSKLVKFNDRLGLGFPLFFAGPEGHPFKSCKGKYATLHKGLHVWTNAAVEDVLAPIESHHLYDRLTKRITRYERFSIPRIAAIVELCIQAGVDIPDYLTKRRRKPIIQINKSEFIDADESDLPDPVPEVPPKPLLTEAPISQIVAPSNEDGKLLLAEETLAAWEKNEKRSQ